MPGVRLSGEQNITFLNIPRTAGTSIGHWLMRHAGNCEVEHWYDHPTLLEVTDQPGFSFAVIRNPWDRLYSMYSYITNWDPNKANDAKFSTRMRVDIGQANGWAQRWPTFSSWVVQLPVVSIPQGRQQPWHTAQTKWAKGCDRLICYDRLEEELSTVPELAHLPLPLPVENQSHRARSYRNHFDDHTRQLVADWFAADIALFKFEF
jgi:chondroitin 4-sulfotransferase 11